jgi:hypothetical protein
MARTSWLAGSTVVFALIAMTANAHAGPVGATTKELVSAGQTGAILQEVQNRVCWRENGIRRCRSLNNVRVYGYQSPLTYGGQRAYGYQAPAAIGVAPPIGYGYLPTRDQVETDPDQFPIGSMDWWQAMDFQDRGGQQGGSQ